MHIICDRINDHDEMLRSIARMDFTVAPGRGDGAKNGGGPDPRDPTWAPRGRTSASRPFGRPPNKMKSSVSAAMIFTNRTLSQSTHTRYSVKKNKSLPRVA